MKLRLIALIFVIAMFLLIFFSIFDLFRTTVSSNSHDIQTYLEDGE